MMMTGHLLVAVASGIGSAALSLAVGQSIWMAFLLYVAGGNLGLLCSVVASLAWPPARRSAMRVLAHVSERPVP
ncbi:hypothetical protein [Rubellimicrobium aerolatum]|uniref:Uncharacterized protein n=1 Tax=Rubellimicrobium aerolatum TaxID=490979 RepID=A0ABW0SCS6_9RHOB|nr:hypothetical protein [Rubellimicrobium aerolatum]MBP1806610.1 hypothetical protein [Rubellimicrobium aerolatum]